MKIDTNKTKLHVTMLALCLGLLLTLAGCGQGDTGSSTPSTSDLQLSLTTDPSPPKPGPATIIVEVKDSQGKAVDDAKVSVSIRHTGMSHGGIEGELVSQGSGRYHASGSFSMTGTWRAQVKANKQGSPQKEQSFDLAVK